MPLSIPKQDATPEQINSWIIETQKNYDTMEIELEEKKKRETELLTENNKLFVKITSKKEEEKDDKEEIPTVLDKKTFEMLSKKDIEELNELMEGEDD